MRRGGAERVESGCSGPTSRKMRFCRQAFPYPFLIHPIFTLSHIPTKPGHSHQQPFSLQNQRGGGEVVNYTSTDVGEGPSMRTGSSWGTKPRRRKHHSAFSEGKQLRQASPRTSVSSYCDRRWTINLRTGWRPGIGSAYREHFTWGGGCSSGFLTLHY